MKQARFHSALAAVMLLAVIFLLSLVFPVVHANGDDPPVDVIQPEQLVIQLGPQWAGVEFQLKTDYGLYPGTIPVGSDGVLRLEIGGSSSYFLSCIGSDNVPNPDEVPGGSIPNEPDTTPGAEPEPTTPLESTTADTPEEGTWQERDLLVVAVLGIQSLALLGLLIANLVLNGRIRKLRRALYTHSC